MLLCSSTAASQSLAPYNPDANNDGLINVYDLQDFLSNYGLPFESIAFEVSQNVCSVGGGSSSYSEWHYYLGGLGCKAVTYRRQSGQSRPLVIHLPVNDNGEGDEIDLITVATTGGGGTQNQPIRIEYFTNGGWEVLASMGYGGNVGGPGDVMGSYIVFKARFVDGDWVWISESGVDVPFNQPE